MSEATEPWVLLVMRRGPHHTACASALTNAGLRVRSADDGEAGFAALLDMGRCACIVLDADITGLTAGAFLERARSYLRFHGIPCVLVGEVTDQKLLARARLPRDASAAMIALAVNDTVRTRSIPPRSREVAE